MDIKKKRALSVVPLIKITYKNSIASAPLGIGSGFFCKYKGQMLFITAGHLYDKDKKINNPWDWGISIFSNGIHVVLTLGKKDLWQFICARATNKTLSILTHFMPDKIISSLKAFGAKNIDFAFIKKEFIPSQVIYPALDGAVVSGEERIFIETDLSAIPSENEEYGFYGCIKPNEDVSSMISLPNNQKGYLLNFVGYNNLKLKKIDDDILEFESPDNPDKEHVRGCSGAPILDSRGNLVSIVIENVEHKQKMIKNNIYKGKYVQNIIRGINLTSPRIKAILDQTIIN